MTSESVRIGVSGHRERLGADWEWVRSSIDRYIISIKTVTGLSSLARGADQVFARSVLANGGELIAVVPRGGGRLAADAGNEKELDRFRACAAKEIVVEAIDLNEAYFLAGKKVVDLSDRMVFVWDGEPARGAGGTADIVTYAMALGKPALILDPIRKTERRIT